MLMADAQWQNQLLLQYLSNSPTAREIDAEVGDLDGDVLGPEPLLSYLRYNVALEEENLLQLGLEDCAGKAVSLRAMSESRNREVLAQIGRRAAPEKILDGHFPKAFDLPADRATTRAGR